MKYTSQFNKATIKLRTYTMSEILCPLLILWERDVIVRACACEEAKSKQIF